MTDDGMPDFARITQKGQTSFLSPLDLFFDLTTPKGLLTLQLSLYQKDPLMKSKGPQQRMHHLIHGLAWVEPPYHIKIHPNTFCTFATLESSSLVL